MASVPVIIVGTMKDNNSAEPGPEEPKIEWKTGWTPETGWVVVGIPQFPHVTPSK